MGQPRFSDSRRYFLGATGATAVAVSSPCSAGDAPVDKPASQVEQANEKVVNDFCAAWATRDADKIGSFLAKDAVYRMIETSAPTKGREAIMATLKGFLEKASSARFEILRSTVMGNTVLNDRIDYFELEDRKLKFHISGFFWVVDGKIKEWQDYSWPKVDGNDKTDP